MTTPKTSYKNWNFYTKTDLKNYSKTINKILRKALHNYVISLFVLLLLSTNGFSQNGEIQVDTLRTQVFSLSPMSKYTEKVNGLVVGFGHFDNKYIKKQTVNGLNIEANPAPAIGAFIGFMALMYADEVIKQNVPTKSERIMKRKTNYFYEVKELTSKSELQLNGVNISTGCFFKRNSMNGLNVSLGNYYKNFNGLSIAVLGTIANKQNGASVGLFNMNNYQNGFSVGLFNHSKELKGIQIGIYNLAKSNKGLQIGVFNKSFSKSFQLGIWNKNQKRSFPLINW